MPSRSEENNEMSYISFLFHETSKISSLGRPRRKTRFTQPYQVRLWTFIIIDFKSRYKKIGELNVAYFADEPSYTSFTSSTTI